jgi:hypothetical protein
MDEDNIANTKISNYDCTTILEDDNLTISFIEKSKKYSLKISETKTEYNLEGGACPLPPRRIFLYIKYQKNEEDEKHYITVKNNEFYFTVNIHLHSSCANSSDEWYFEYGPFKLLKS